MADLVSASAQAIADALAPSPQAPAARWRWGSVVSVSNSGTMNVSIGGATVPGIRCAQHVMGAQVGDRVRVMYCGTEAIVDAVRATGAWTPWEPDVLYNDPTGESGTVALDASAALYSHMRIYYRTNDDHYHSVDVFEPNGKSVTLSSVSTGDGTAMWIKTGLAAISGTSITRTASRVENIWSNNSVTGSNTNNIYVVRVEAW